MKRATIVILLVAFVAGPISIFGDQQAGVRAQDDFTCDSFSSASAAQSILESDPSDPYHLDPDKNGIACDGGGNSESPMSTPTFALGGDARTASAGTPRPARTPRSALATTTPTPTPDTVASAPLESEALYVGQMKVVQALIATAIPFLSQDALVNAELFDIVGAVQTVLWLDAYVATIEPPPHLAEQHGRATRMISAMAIGAGMFRDGLIQDDTASITVGLIAVETAAASVKEELDALFLLIAVEPAEPLKPVEYGESEETGPSDGDTSGGSGAVHESFSGRGDDVVRVGLDRGIVTISATHSGQSNFAIWLYGPRDQQELVVNEIGAYRGTRAIRIEAAGQHVIDIQADGAWTLTVEQ